MSKSKPSIAFAAPEPSLAEPVPARPDPVPVVGIGATAGGLPALEQFFSAMPEAATGFAFVLVTRLPAARERVLAERVRRLAGIPVLRAEDGMAVLPDRAYLVPADRDPALGAGRLRLLEPVEPASRRLPVDGFFRSLAEDLGPRAVCVILSGTGSDGSLGLRAVRGEGGLVLAQAPETARHPGMPRCAGATGLVDFVLAPGAMVPRLLALARAGWGAEAAAGGALGRILDWVRARTSHDFSSYKEAAIIARVWRRMALLGMERTGDYLGYLCRHPGEPAILHRDLVIGATRFFRDPEAFGRLQRRVIPALPAGARIWVCGCATGEEAYAIAMLALEQAGSADAARPCQIFATDVDQGAIDQARTGVYPASIAADLDPGRLARWFSPGEEAGSLRIRAAVRDLVVFSRHDVLRDPPFAGLDLISCRNLLIYLNPDGQKALVRQFHQGLKPGGVLFLGLSETVGEGITGFRPLDVRLKLYQRRSGPAAAAVLPPRPAGSQAGLQREWHARVAGLQAALGDLGCANAALRSVREELEAVNEELRAANEEMAARSEQQQSIIEGLRAANEELLSVNDELQAANGDLLLGNADLRLELAGLARTAQDLDRLLAGTGLGVLVLDLELRVVRFTPLVTRVFNLRPGDLGRPLAQFTSRLRDAGGVLADCREILLAQVPREMCRQTQEGAWYRLRIRPARGPGGELEGLVLTLADQAAGT